MQKGRLYMQRGMFCMLKDMLCILLYKVWEGTVVKRSGKWMECGGGSMQKVQKWRGSIKKERKNLWQKIFFLNFVHK